VNLEFVKNSIASIILSVANYIQNPFFVFLIFNTTEIDVQINKQINKKYFKIIYLKY